LGWADGGGKIKQAPLRPIIGRDAVARFSLGTKRFWPENARVELEEVNGQAALIIRADGQVSLLKKSLTKLISEEECIAS
jgi:RNA polymerase sigma-70 factor, ECF subfamily